MLSPRLAELEAQLFAGVFAEESAFKQKKQTLRCNFAQLRMTLLAGNKKGRDLFPPFFLTLDPRQNHSGMTRKTLVTFPVS